MPLHQDRLSIMITLHTKQMRAKFTQTFYKSNNILLHKIDLKYSNPSQTGILGAEQSGKNIADTAAVNGEG